MQIHKIQPPADGWAGLSKYYRTDAVAGFLVFLIALPLSLGIALASGFPPLAGVLTAIVGGLIVGLFAGSHLTIKGPAAGLIAIAIGAVETFGQGDMLAGYRFTLAIIVVAGVLQVLFGVLKAGALGEFFPASAVHGMLAAIGIIIISKQVHVLLGVKPAAKEPLALLEEIPRSLLELNPEIAFIGLMSLLLLVLLPQIKNQFVRKIPAPLVVILFAIPAGYFFDLDREHDYVFSGRSYHIGRDFLVNLPENLLSGITFPDFSQILTATALQYVIMFALVGSLESLLTVEAIDHLDPYKRKSDANKDLFAVGVGNVICGMIGGLPMIAEVVRSSANVNNGAKTRWANWFHGLFLLLFVALLPGLIHRIPLAALAAMLVYTGYKLAAPQHFYHAWKIGKEQLLIFVVTIIVTLATDLLLGVLAGIVVKMLVLLGQGAKLRSFFRASLITSATDGQVVTVRFQDAALFSNYLIFRKLLAKIPAGKKLVLNFLEASIIDHTFMERIQNFAHEYERNGGSVTINGLEHHRPFSEHPLAGRKRVYAQD
ncbi:SulP family inorganic anion transporter [Rhodoflexus sp.]